MKLWSSLLFCIISFCAQAEVLKSGGKLVDATSQANLTWFLYSDGLEKFDGHSKFNANELTSRLASPFLSIHHRNTFLWIGHQQGLSRINLTTSEVRDWLQSPVSKIGSHGHSLIFQSRSKLYQLQDDLISVLPFKVQSQLWHTSERYVTFISNDNKLQRWNSESGTEVLASLPWPVKKIFTYKDKVVLKNASNDVYVFAEKTPKQPLLNSQNLFLYHSQLLYFNGSYLNSYDLDKNIQYQHQIDNLPIDDIKTTANGIWISQLGKWKTLSLTELTIKSDIQSSEEIKIYQQGMQAFNMFANNQPINAVRYLESGRWAVATDEQIFIFSTEKGSFTPLINKSDVKAIYFTGKRNLWVTDTNGMSLYDLSQKKQLHYYSIRDIHSVSQLSDSQFIASTPDALWLLGSDHSKKLSLPFKDLAFYDVYYSKDNDTLFISTHSGLYELVLVNDQVISMVQRNQYNGKYLSKAEEQSFWQFDKQGIAHYKDTVTTRLISPFQKQRQVLSFRQKLMLLNDGFALVAEQSKNPNIALSLSHVQYYYSDKTTQSYMPSLPLEITPGIKRLSLWFSSCDDCQLSYRLSDETPWQAIDNFKLTLTPSEVKTLEILASSDRLSKILAISSNSPTQAWWHWLIIVLFFTVGIIWLIKRQLQTSNTKLTAHFSDMLMAHSKDAIWLADEQFNVIKVNRAYTDITGFSAEALVGKKPKIYTDEGRDIALEEYIITESQLNDYWTGEIWTLSANHQKLALDVTVTKLTHEEHPSEVFYLGVLTNISERKANEQMLLTLSTRDSITGLANRALFNESLNQAIVSCNTAFPSLLLVLIDIDHFRKINDLMGHESGDALLKEVANRLANHLDKGYTLARVSSDEFAVLIPPYLFSGMTIFFAKKLADDILKCINHPFTHLGVETSVSASCGLAIYPDDAKDSEHLIRCADSALDHAKHKGHNSYQFFDKQRHQLDPTILSRETALLRGIDDCQFKLYFQPKYKADQRSVIGFEGLVRWLKEDGSIEQPSSFIPFAEECGAIIPLTHYLLDCACRQIAHWRKIGLSGNQIAINISAKHFENDLLVTTVRECIQKYNIPARSLEMEITESAMMADSEQALKIIHRLKALGITIALDDFGTGHSSLGYLKRFPIDTLKIDRSFIMDFEHSEQDRNITATIIRLAKYLNMKVVAEGVENEKQAYLLSVMGCTILQGYYFSKPIPANQATELLISERETLTK